MFSLNGKRFYQILAYLDKVIEEDCVVPTLASYLVVPGRGCVRMVASDTETTISINVAADTEGADGPFLVDAKRFTKAMKEMPDDTIRFSVSDPNLEFSWASGSGSLGILTDTEQYPSQTEREEPMKRFSIPSGLLAGCLGRVLYAVGKDEMRPAIGGVHFDIRSRDISVVATDVRVLAVDRICKEEDREDIVFTVGVKPSSIIRKIASKGSGPVDVSYYGKDACFVIGDYEIAVRLIEGKFPAFRTIVPDVIPKAATAVEVDRDRMLEMIRRVATCTDTLTGVVVLTFTEGRLAADGKDLGAQAYASDSMECGYGGPDRTVGLTVKRLLPALENLPEGKLRLHLMGEGKAVILRQVVEDDETEDVISAAAVMPVAV